MNFMPKPRIGGYVIFQSPNIWDIINIRLILRKNLTPLPFSIHLLPKARNTRLGVTNRFLV